MANHRITVDVAPHRAEWMVLYTAYAEYYKVEQSQEMRDRTWSWIIDGKIICLMALDENDHPVGFAHIREFLRPLSSTVAGYLDDLFVDPATRGSGVVNLLFDAAKALGGEKNWSVIRWITRDDNYRGRSVYDRVATRTNWVTYDLTP
jgi:ribosomal protein S18 acetylase RimI-like enzyme